MFCAQCGTKLPDGESRCDRCTLREAKHRDPLAATADGPTDFEAPPRSRKGLSRVSTVLLALASAFLLTFLAQQWGKQAGHRTAAGATSFTAIAAGMPDGFFGVRLSMTPREVRSVRPAAERVPGDTHFWAELTTWEGIPVRAIYDFGDHGERLMMITMNVQGPGTPEMFSRIHEILDRQYGPLSAPLPEDNYQLRAARSAGGVAIYHVLYHPVQDRQINQIMLYKGR